MARPATSRTAPSQSQPRRNQSQRHSNRGVPDDDDDEPMESDAEEEREDSEQHTLARKANDLVRLVLFSEHKRVPLKREEITKKVLGSNSRSFKVVFDEAQQILRKTFGMEMVELKSRAELDVAINGAGDDDAEEARNQAGGKRRAAAAGSKTYILRTTLDPIIVEYAALTDAKILEEESVEDPDDFDPDNSFGTRSYGSIISWSRSDQLGLVGLLYVILALILVSGRVMSEGDLRANLKRLHLPPTAKLSFTPQSTEKPQNVDAYLTHLIKQGYLDRQRTGDNKGAGAKRGRGRAIVATQGDGAEEAGTWEWRWGNRAQSEVGEKGVAAFIAEFMVERLGGEGADDEEEEGVAGPSRRRRGNGRTNAADASVQRMERIMRGIERAAGGNLAGLL